jgi:hypothetical protein
MCWCVLYIRSIPTIILLVIRSISSCDRKTSAWAQSHGWDHLAVSRWWNRSLGLHAFARSAFWSTFGPDSKKARETKPVVYTSSCTWNGCLGVINTRAESLLLEMQLKVYEIDVIEWLWEPLGIDSQDLSLHEKERKIWLCLVRPIWLVVANQRSRCEVIGVL